MEERKDVIAALRESYLIIIWFIVIVGIRVILLLIGKLAVVDDFGFFELTKSGEWKTTLSSGVAFAYEGTLSLFMRFAGNTMDFVPIYHVILQIAALLLLFIGCRQLFGKGAAFLVGTVLGISSWMLSSIFQVSPGNFYFFHWSVVFFLIGNYYKRTEVIGWFRTNAGEIYLIITGFYLGIVCIWHYAGLLLIPFVIYAQIKNAPSLRDRISVRQNILDMEEIMSDDDDWDDWDDWDEQLEEQLEMNNLVVDSREYMPTLSQSGILIVGALLGAYCTLMKYTGVTGNFIKGQGIWWLGLYRVPVMGKLWQDVPFSLLCWMAGSILAGIIFALILNTYHRRRKLEAEILEAKEFLKESKNAGYRKQIGLEPIEEWAGKEPEPETWEEPVEEVAESESESEPEEAVESEPEPEPESEPELISEPEIESESEPISEPEIESEPEGEFEAEEMSESEGEFETEGEPESEWEQEHEDKPQPDLDEEIEIETQSDQEEEIDTEEEFEPVSESEPESDPEYEPEPISEIESEPEPISEPEIEPEPEEEFETEEEPESEWEQEHEDKLQPDLDEEVESESESEIEPEPEPESEPELISEPEPEIESEPEGEFETEEEPEFEEEIQPKSKRKKSKKKVKLIDNPLPVPKRQVRPKVEFDIDEKDDDFDFDVDVDSNDDFDV